MANPESQAENVDKAFELLVVIIALIYSIMQSYSGLFWSSTPEISLEIQTMRNTVLPVIILTLLWLSSRLSSSQNIQIFFKFVAWMTAFSLSVALFLGYLNGVRLIQFNVLLENLLLLSIFLINPVIVYFLVFPKYKKHYEGASFFKSYLWTVLSFVGYLLIMGLIIWVSSAMFTAW